jgi:hypothetical protein
MTNYRVALILLLGSLCMATACSRSGVPNATNASHASSSRSSQLLAGQSISGQATPGQAIKAYVDPTTGELRDPPTSVDPAASVKATDKMPLSVSAAEQSSPHEIVHPGGMVEVPLDQTKQQTLQACIEKDGSMQMGHDCAAQPKSKK